MRFTAAYTLASGVIMIPPEVNGAQIYVSIVKQLSARQLVAVAAGEDAMNRYEDTVIIRGQLTAGGLH